MQIAGGSTDVTTYFAMRLAADGSTATGLTPADFDLQYVRSGETPSAKVDATALAATDSAHADNKVIEIDAVDQPGVYRVDWPDAAFVAGIPEVILTAKVATAFTEHLRMELDVAKDALVALNLDHLMKVAAVDADVVDDSIIAQLADAGSTSNYANYSKTEDSQRAISEKVSSIGSASGGGFNFPAVGSDALTDNINDAEDAVDKVTVPATVGIPVTGHTFLAGHEVTIAGTANYNGSFPIDSVTANEVVIVSAFLAETFSASDTIVSSIKGESIEGVETLNTFGATVSEDGVYHIIDDDGADNFTISYRVEVGGGRRATEAVFHGFLNSGNDNAFVQAYDFVADAWETRALLDGQNGSVNQTITIPLLSRNTGTDGVDLGVVFLRITDDAAAGSTNPTLNVDSFLVEAVGIGQTAGYQNGQIWVDTLNGFDGTESFVNGTSDKPVKTWEDALALSANLNITDFHIINGSTITLSANSDRFSLFGDNWILDLNGQSCAASHFQGATVSGTFTGTPEFDDCAIGSITGPAAEIHNCGLDGTITANAAGSWVVHHCYSAIAGVTTPIFDFGTDVGVNTNITLGGYRNGIEFRNLNNAGADLLSLSGTGQVIYAASCSGTVNQRGEWKVTNTGGVMITEDDNTANIAATASVATEVRLAELDAANLPAGIDAIFVATGGLGGAAMRGTDSAALASVATEARLAELDAANLPADIDAIPGLIATVQADLDVITDVDGVILGEAGVDLIWDEVLTGATHNIINSAARRLREISAVLVLATGTAQAGTNSTITLAADSDPNDDFHNDTRVVIVGGTGVGQARIVHEHDGTTKIATIAPDWVVNPDNTSEYQIQSQSHVHVHAFATEALAEIISAVLNSQMTESYAANGVAPTLAQAQFAMHQMLMQFGIIGTNFTVRKLDDVTTAFIVTLNDDTDPTDVKRV